MNGETDDRITSAVERIALVLAAIYAHGLKDDDLGTKAGKLCHLGFSNSQVADALGTTANSVNVALHKKRKRK